MRTFFLSLSLAFLLLLPAGNASASRTPKTLPQPQATPAQLIAAINEYRAANGLPPYQQNNILMSTAQGQADYQASISTVTHTGPGGTRPIDRAYAAGYGGGDKIFVSEIIYGGGTATVNTAVNWWKGSQIHNDTMLASTYQEIGAGVAANGSGYMYFTAVTGWVANGVAPPTDSGSNLAGSAGTDSGSAPPIPIAVPVIVATPQADGSIVHVIRTGQVLWTVAAVYGVPLEELLEINNLPENALIFPGDEVLVKLPAGEGAVAEEEQEEAVSVTPTPRTRPTNTPRPTRTPPAATAIAAANLDSQQIPQQQPAANAPASSNDAVRWIVLIAFSSIFLVFLSSFFMRKTQAEISSAKEQPTPNNDPLTQDDVLK
jgi:uncharacterized protein YkwD